MSSMKFSVSTPLIAFSFDALALVCAPSIDTRCRVIAEQNKTLSVSLSLSLVWCERRAIDCA